MTKEETSKFTMNFYDKVSGVAGNVEGNQNIEYTPKQNKAHAETDRMQQADRQKQKILILSAIPYEIRSAKEIREIVEAIRRATRRDIFDIRIRTAVRFYDIRRAIAEEQPNIVHFCGHGLKNGSLLLEDDGENDSCTPQRLASLFELHDEYVKCVLLNACYSEKSAEAISEHIDYVIGMNNSIQDKAAIEFTQGFYDGLGYKIFDNQNVFQRAFKEAKVAISMENSSHSHILFLKKNLIEPNPTYPQLSETPIYVSEVELRSERGVDYSLLRDFLAAQKWKEADQETVKVMFEAAGMTSEGKLRGEHIDNFPCEDLRTINQLWLHYSKGKFGFSVQKEIYNSRTLVQVYNSTVWEKVGDEFGWRKGGNWLKPDDLTFKLLDAPKGHLPWFLCGYVEDGFLLSRTDL